MAVVEEEAVVLNLDGRWKLSEGMSERRGSLIMIHYENLVNLEMYFCNECYAKF